MKHTKRLLAAVMALAMVSAIAPMSAFAINQDDVKNGNGKATGTMTATYDVTAKYTVTIPAGVNLDSEDSVSATFEASDVVLESGQKIKVTLNSADHTTSGATFHAQTDNGDSTATYTIGKGEATEGVKVGDVVAEFTENGDQTLTFSKAEGATYAGTHTETLTFGISTENATPANPYAAANVGDVVTFGIYDWYVINKRDNGVTLLMKEYLTTKAYNDSNTNITWETCTLRAYLNGEFYNSFDADDKAKIVKTSNTNPNNPDPDHSTSGGNDTEDYIYLLSIAEANALDNSIRVKGSVWLLRSPGFWSNSSAVVNNDGGVNTMGRYVDMAAGVRPALNLEF